MKRDNPAFNKDNLAKIQDNPVKIQDNPAKIQDNPTFRPGLSCLQLLSPALLIFFLAGLSFFARFPLVQD